MRNLVYVILIVSGVATKTVRWVESKDVKQWWNEGGDQGWYKGIWHLVALSIATVTRAFIVINCCITSRPSPDSYFFYIFSWFIMDQNLHQSVVPPPITLVSVLMLHLSVWFCTNVLWYSFILVYMHFKDSLSQLQYLKTVSHCSLL